MIKGIGDLPPEFYKALGAFLIGAVLALLARPPRI